MKKKCVKCKQEKELDEFGFSKSEIDKKNRRCKICCRSYRLVFLEKNPGYEKEISKQVRLKYPTNNREALKKYRDNSQDKDKRRKYDREYCQQRRKKDLYFAMMDNLKSRIRFILQKRTDSSDKLIGCTSKFLREYLEKQFKPGMNWDNYGKSGWHIDHIKPIAAFNLLELEEQRNCFHYTNLQPLWSKENISKGANYKGINYKNQKQ